MNQSSMSKWMKLIIIAVGACGSLVYGWVIPSLGQMLAANNPEFAFCYWPWLIVIWITAVPFYVILAFAWKIAGSVRKSRSFTIQNAKRLKWIAVLAATDAGFFFIMNIVYLFLNMNHPGIVLLSLGVFIIGTAISAISAILSNLVKKAADLQEQSDLTI